MKKTTKTKGSNSGHIRKARIQETLYQGINWGNPFQNYWKIDQTTYNWKSQLILCFRPLPCLSSNINAVRRANDRRNFGLTKWSRQMPNAKILSNKQQTRYRESTPLWISYICPEEGATRQEWMVKRTRVGINPFIVLQ